MAFPLTLSSDRDLLPHGTEEDAAGEERRKTARKRRRPATGKVEVALWRMTSQATDATVFRRSAHQGLWRKRKEGTRQKRRE